jgi:phosphoribosylanthranilate isomerase
MVVKVCGMNEVGNLEAISAFKPDYFGFIFYEKSPRNFSLEQLPDLKNIKTVGVFVNAEIDIILNNQLKYNLNAIQLHGNETVEYILELKKSLKDDVQIFKALSVSEVKDFSDIKNYECHVDLFILDTKTPLKGGSGKKFDWDLLEHYKLCKPFLLSGGVGPKDSEEIFKAKFQHKNMIGIDINSKFEVEPGLKDVDQLSSFITNIKK